MALNCLPMLPRLSIALNGSQLSSNAPEALSGSQLSPLTKQGENVQAHPIYLVLERIVPKHILRKIFEKKSISANWSTNQFCAALNEIVKSENELNTIYANDSDSKKELDEHKPWKQGVGAR